MAWSFPLSSPSTRMDVMIPDALYWRTWQLGLSTLPCLTALFL
jgi:hypothetical protein